MVRFAAPVFRRTLFLLGGVVLGLLVLGGCGKQPITDHTVIRSSPSTQQSPTSKKTASILRLARSLIGVPYKWGGESPRQGFDCSGFVWFVYRQNGVSIPRISWQQFGAGRAVSYGDMRPGDLIFHQIEKKAKSLHVGIVTNRGTFIHSPSSGKTVMESSLNNTYWRSHYLGTRRVLK